MDAPRLRFAPSPSGYLHIGGARTALFCWLLARRHAGTFILRVEDTDAARSTDASIEAILGGMRWLGLDWDEGPEVGGPNAPYRQSERGPLYQDAIARLLAEGRLYPCTCTTEELAAKREAALALGQPTIYDGTCRGQRPSELAAGTPYVLRLRASESGETVVDDCIKGRIVFPNRELGDQVVVRTNGDPLYNFVVVIDDVLMGMTHVVRGDDHLSNTPKQVQLYEALGATPPVFAHVPLILGPDKKRLSKRHGATSLLAYRDEGYLPSAMMNYLARLGWSHGDQEIFTVDELIAAFSLPHVGKSPGVWDPQKLLWVQEQHIAALSNDALADALRPFLRSAGYDHSDPLLPLRVETLRGRARLLPEFVAAGRFYWCDDDELEAGRDPRATEKFLTPAAGPLLDAALVALRAVSPWESTSIEAALTPLLEQFGVGMGKLAQPMRVALTGTSVSPGLFESLAALGRDKTFPRLRRGIALCAGLETP